jgi:hypothetical protein
MSPYERVMAALKHHGFIKNGKPHCPMCPPSKRQGFGVTEAKTADGRPTVLLNCFRDHDRLEIVATIGLEPADLFDGGVRRERLFEGERFCRVTVQGWKALGRSARTFAIAAAVGYYSSAYSPYTLLRSPSQWEDVRREAGLTNRGLELNVRDWCQRKMAHRCAKRGLLALYRGPLDRCPNCGRLTLEKRKSQTTSTRKDARKRTQRSLNRHGSDTTHASERSVRIKRSVRSLGEEFDQRGARVNPYLPDRGDLLKIAVSFGEAVSDERPEDAEAWADAYFRAALGEFILVRVADEEQFCQAITRDGSLCSRRHLPDDQVCKLHRRWIDRWEARRADA